VDARWDGASGLTGRCEGGHSCPFEPTMWVTQQMCERELRCNLLRTEHSPKDSSDPIQIADDVRTQLADSCRAVKFFPSIARVRSDAFWFSAAR
jgi:hypothetical protein